MSEEIEVHPYKRPGKWFVIHTYAGYEQKVKGNLDNRIAAMNMEDAIFEMAIPMEQVVEYKNGQKVNVAKKIFPGYILVRMHMNDDSWSCVRNTSGVTGFAGLGNTPVSLTKEEVERFLIQEKKEEQAGPVVKHQFEVGYNVQIKSGPFGGFMGSIEEIDDHKGSARVLVNIFGRETPIEIEFNQITKV